MLLNATDGYRHAPIELLRGICADHFQRGADSVVTFNGSVGPDNIGKSVDWAVASPAHQLAYHEIGALGTMAGKDKVYAVERRGGYPWAEGYFNRNDEAPLPAALPADGRSLKLTIHIGDPPGAENARLFIRCTLFGMEEGGRIALVLNGAALKESVRDARRKDPQVFSPRPQPASGGKADYRIDPKQRLLCVDFAVPANGWRQGPNEIELVRVESGSDAQAQLETLEAHLSY